MTRVAVASCSCPSVRAGMSREVEGVAQRTRALALTLPRRNHLQNPRL